MPIFTLSCYATLLRQVSVGAEISYVVGSGLFLVDVHRAQGDVITFCATVQEYEYCYAIAQALVGNGNTATFYKKLLKTFQKLQLAE